MNKLVSLVALAVSLATVPAAAQGRPRAREERREERREQIQDRRDQRRDAIDGKKKRADPGVNRRQRRQGSRIVGGVRSGQLTKAEVDALAAHEASLRTLEASFKSDGVLTREEREKLHAELNALSRTIRSEKTDADTTAPLRIRDGNDTRAAAQKGRRLIEVRRELNRPDLTPEQRNALETEHAALVDALYEETLDE